MMKYHFIAHRGDREFYPENTVEGLISAAGLGAEGLEFDVQITRDRVAVVTHDVDLDRCCGVRGNVLDLGIEALSGISAGEPSRFGTLFADCRLPKLSTLVDALNRTKCPEVFVEIKEESIDRHGRDEALDILSDAMAHAQFSWALISFDYDILLEARRQKAWKIGWVLPEDTDWDRSLLSDMRPEFAFAALATLKSRRNKTCKGSWRWVVYGVNHPGDVEFLEKMDIFDYETDRLGFMLEKMNG